MSATSAPCLIGIHCALYACEDTVARVDADEPWSGKEFGGIPFPPVFGQTPPLYRMLILGRIPRLLKGGPKMVKGEDEDQADMDLKAINATRESLYSLLRRLYAIEIDEEFIAQLRDSYPTLQLLGSAKEKGDFN